MQRKVKRGHCVEPRDWFAKGISGIERHGGIHGAKQLAAIAVGQRNRRDCTVHQHQLHPLKGVNHKR
jgi:hypothetical protein